MKKIIFSLLLIIFPTLLLAQDLIVPWFRIGGKLWVNKSIKADSLYTRIVNINNAYKLPTSDGSNGQALITNGTGTLSFGTFQADTSSLWTRVGTVTYMTNTDDYVGIGLSSATAKLHIKTAVDQIGLHVIRDASSASPIVKIQQDAEDDTASLIAFNKISNSNIDITTSGNYDDLNIDPQNDGNINLWGSFVIKSDSGGVYVPYYSTNDNLVLHLSFSEGTGAKTYDAGIYGYIAELNNTPTWGSGKYGHCLTFDRTNSEYAKIEDDDSLAFGTTSFTYSFWMKHDAEGLNSYPIGRGYRNTGNRGYGIELRSDNIFMLVFICDETTDAVDWIGSSANEGKPYDNEWHFYVITVDRTNNEMKTYIDAKMISNYDISSVTGNISCITDNFKVGSNTGGPFTGSIDEVKVFNKVLSEHEILMLWNSQGDGVIKTDEFRVLNSSGTINGEITSNGFEGNIRIKSSTENFDFSVSGTELLINNTNGITCVKLDTNKHFVLSGNYIYNSDGTKGFGWDGTNWFANEGIRTADELIVGDGTDSVFLKIESSKFVIKNNSSTNIFELTQNGAMTVDTLKADAMVYQDGSELTIATGAITVTKAWHKVDTELDAASDDLDTINGGAAGMEIRLQAADNTRTVVLKNGTGNLSIGSDRTLDNVKDLIILFYDGSSWVLAGFYDNGDSEI